MPSLTTKIKRGNLFSASAWKLHLETVKEKFRQGQEKAGYSIGLLMFIIFVGLEARIWFLGQVRDFWHDESFQWIFSQKPIAFILAGSDVHPPLYNLVAKFLIWINRDVIFLRFTSVIFSLYFLYYAFLMMRKLWGNQVGYIGTALLALAPTIVYLSTEFRNYSWALIFIPLQILAFNMMLRENTLKERWKYIAFSLIMMYSHYMTGLIIFCQVLYLFFFKTPFSDNMWSMIKQYWIKIYLPMAILMLPLFYYLYLSIIQMHSFWFKNIGFHSLISTFFYIIIPPIDRPIGFAMYFYGILFFGLWYYRKELKPEHIQFLFYLFIPPILMFIISLTAIQFYAHRYFIFGGISLYILVAWILVRMSVKTPDLDQCAVAFMLFLCIMGYQEMAKANNTEIYESAVFLENYTTSQNITDFATIHTSQFSGTPYHVYFPNRTHYLLTNFTKEERFTAGGSAIEDNEVIQNLSLVTTIDKPLFFISDKYHDNELINIRGLHLSRIK